MDLVDKVKEIAGRIERQRDHIQTEEATKNAFIMPFIAALGYDVFNPMEVIPEFTADVGTKKGEKVDYAISKDDKTIMLFECKYCGADLHKDHAAQLHRYFHVTESRFGILTNGIIYRFYSDLDQPNKMDSKPFFEFNMLDFEDHQIAELKKFTQSAFSVDDILTTASKLKHTRAIKKVLREELENPSEEFVRFFLSRIYDGPKRQQVIEEFKAIVKEARRQFINEQINNRLQSALQDNEPEPVSEAVPVAASTDRPESDSSKPGVVTTADEVDGFNIIRAILREVIDVKRVYMRDTKSYCGIILDDNNRKPICRLHLDHAQWYLGLISNKQEERVSIDSLDDIFKYADRIKAALSEYE